MASECKDVDIRTFKLQYPKIFFPGKTQYTDSPQPEGLRIVRELNSINPFNWIKTGIKLKREKADILLIRYWIPFMAPCLGTVARIVKSNKYTLIISIVDNVFPHEKRFGDRLFTRYFMRCLDGAVALSYSVQKDIESFRNDIPLGLTYHPIFDNYGRKTARNEALKTLNLDPETSYLLFFGIIRDYKGLDLLIEAFADSRLRNRNLKLIVAGEFYNNENSYRQQIASYKLEDEVIIYNRFINDAEVGLFFSGADLVVQPYKTATQSGITQIAYQFDKPMLVTDTGGLKEIVKHQKCGYVVKPDPKEIADAIYDYFVFERKPGFTECVKKEKAKFSWSRMTDTINEVFYKCLLQQLIKAL